MAHDAHAVHTRCVSLSMGASAVARLRNRHTIVGLLTLLRCTEMPIKPL